MKISKEAIDAIKGDSDLRAKLMLANGKSEYTIKRWIEENDEKLTMPIYTAVVMEHTGFTLKQILEKTTA